MWTSSLRFSGRGSLPFLNDLTLLRRRELLSGEGNMLEHSCANPRCTTINDYRQCRAGDGRRQCPSTNTHLRRDTCSNTRHGTDPKNDELGAYIRLVHLDQQFLDRNGTKNIAARDQLVGIDFLYPGNRLNIAAFMNLKWTISVASSSSRRCPLQISAVNRSWW
jgi:hypothetical protein